MTAGSPRDRRPSPLELPGGGLSDHDYRRLAAFIQSTTGIKMPPTKRTMLEGRLRKRVRILGMTSLSDYCRFVFDEGGLVDEELALIDVVTTNKTDFFREPQHFRFLAEKIIPQHLANSSGQPLRLWSSACSTGAEPYTIAMVCQKSADLRSGLDYEITATDISTEVLEAARRGVYSTETIEPVSHELRKRFFLKSRDPSRAEVRVIPELRARLRFGRLNLLDGSYPFRQPFDVIFCRNLLIYFDRPTQRAVLHRLCGVLKPGGYLILGHSESIAGMGLPVTAMASTVFRREEG